MTQMMMWCWESLGHRWRPEVKQRWSKQNDTCWNHEQCQPMCFSWGDNGAKKVEWSVPWWEVMRRWVSWVTYLGCLSWKSAWGHKVLFLWNAILWDSLQGSAKEVGCSLGMSCEQMVTGCRDANVNAKWYTSKSWAMSTHTFLVMR